MPASIGLTSGTRDKHLHDSMADSVDMDPLPYNGSDLRFTKMELKSKDDVRQLQV